jgi:aryl carrier-like protein
LDNDNTQQTPQEKRRSGTSVRLRAAFGRLVAVGAKLTVAALAREAGVGRNAIYVNHRDIIADLLQATSRSETNSEPNQERSPETDWRAVAAQMKEQVRVLATENARLLKRALDAEQTMERTERWRRKLEDEIRALRAPVHLPSGPTD